MDTTQDAPETVVRTGTMHFTIIEAHPYHHPIGRTDHKGAGVYARAYEPRCPRCRTERQQAAERFDSQMPRFPGSGTLAGPPVALPSDLGYDNDMSF